MGFSRGCGIIGYGSFWPAWAFETCLWEVGSRGGLGVGGIHKAQGSSASSHLRGCNHVMPTYLPQDLSPRAVYPPCSQKPNPKNVGHTQTKRQPATPYCLRPIPQHEIPSPASYGSGFIKGFRKRDSVGLQSSCGRLIDGALTSSLRLRRHGGGTWLAILRT